MARIVIVGSGVVGQATGKGFARKGHHVSYVDINHQTIAQLRSAGCCLTAAEVDWRAVDVVMLAVSTPSVDDRIVLDYIEAAALDVGRGLAQAEQFVPVVVRSTVPPTTTEQRITPDPGACLGQARRRRFRRGDEPRISARRSAASRISRGRG